MDPRTGERFKVNGQRLKPYIFDVAMNRDIKVIDLVDV
jgi:hypothetical protein